MNAQKTIPFVDTTIIPDRNAGIGSLLLELQDSPKMDGLPLLGHDFAFIDVGVSYARVSTALKTLLTKDLRMNVDYVATELPEMVPYAFVTPSGDREKAMHIYLSRMISSGKTTREVMDWHYVIDRKGKITSVAYSYNHYGNEVWEAYFMGRPFLISGKKVEFRDTVLDEIMAPDIKMIGELIGLEMKRDNDPVPSEPEWNGYRMEKNPLEAGLAEFGISLQKTDVPQRIMDRQNVLYLGNVLNHYPKEEQANELDQVAVNMQEGDIVIVQTDDMESSSIEVFQVRGLGNRKSRERVRWINSGKLEVSKPVPGTESWQQNYLKPVLELIVSSLTSYFVGVLSFPGLNKENHKLLVRQFLSMVFGTFFRAMPVEETLRIAIREALKRIPSGGSLKGIPVFRNDSEDAYGNVLGPDQSPLISDEEMFELKMIAEDRLIGDPHLN